jgi:putative nucleotidyltransferase with HDIG domain
MAETHRVLGQNLYPLFDALPAQYQRHALTVYRRVCDAGCTDLHVLQAAILHDAGKYDPATRRHVTIAHRVIIVLLKAGPPGKRLLKKLAHPTPHGLRGYLLYPFHLNQHHAELGARLATRHGAPPEVVDLIADHHRHDIISAQLATLQDADDQS